MASMEIRQHPQHALVSQHQREKSRKPIDPPPIVQLKVDLTADAGQENWHVSPYLFLIASLVKADPENGAYEAVPGPQLVGHYVSSLYWLKDTHNRDGGFFVFDDISCRSTGQFRLQFSLLDLDKHQNQVAFIGSVVSQPFDVVTNKEFRGLQESTLLSRTFSDQGVRLRLRKGIRTVTGKRGFSNLEPQTQTPSAHSNLDGRPVRNRQYSQGTPDGKRQRSDSDYFLYNPSRNSGGATPQYDANLQRSASPSSAQQYSSRTSLGLCPTLPWLQIDTDSPETGGDVREHRRLLPASSDIADHVGKVSAGKPSAHGAQHYQDLARSHDQCKVTPMPINLHDQSHQPTPQTAANITTFDTPFKMSAIPYDQGQYTDVQSFFEEPVRDACPQGISVFSDGSVSLDTGVLGRGYTPPYTEQQQVPYSTSAEQELTDFAKSRLDVYPAPHHTSLYG